MQKMEKSVILWFHLEFLNGKTQERITLMALS